MNDGGTGTVTGVVLAGGDSVRFGSEDKLTAPVAGRPLVARVVDVLVELTDSRPILAVGSRDRTSLANALADPDTVRTVTDDERFEGPVAGLYGALERVEATWTFACAGDMPLLSPRAVAKLVQRAGPNTDAVVPVDAGRTEPLHAVYRTSALERIAGVIPTSGGVRTVIEPLESVRTVPVGEHLERSLTNVNTGADLSAVRNAAPTREEP